MKRLLDEMKSYKEQIKEYKTKLMNEEESNSEAEN